ncbi:MAG: four helix bundle protein [Bacteroidales bacterium]|nr:four helix bundle protein [Bacteroidales bacterium]
MTPEQENTISFFRFEDLRIYSKAIDYITWLYSVTSTFSEGKSVDLKKNFMQSAQGIALNVAEGSARNKAQFVYYLKMAKSSVRECVVFTEIAAKLTVMSEEEKEYSRNQLMELTKMIGSLVASLQRTALAKDEPMPDDDEMPEMI